MKLQCFDVADDDVQVRAVGRIAPDAAEQLSDPLIALLGPQVFTRRVALDLSDSEFISSAGIGWLLHLHKQFERHGGKLTLRPVSREVDQVLRMMRLESVLNLAESST